MNSRRPQPEEVEHLLRNAQLRDELEPFLDESIVSINVQELPTPVENEFLASMLAWERAPVYLLWQTIHSLFEKRIVLDFTDHLSDRELYTLIFRDILPSSEKKIDSPENYLHWDCANMGDDPEIWLRYYASEEDRQNWASDLPGPLPEREDPPFPRQLPRRPL
jgi:hypothetical protein